MKIKIIKYFQRVAIFFITLFSINAHAARLESLVVKETASQISIFCTVNGKFDYKAFVLKNPNRVVIDFEKTASTVNVSQLLKNSPSIQHVRVGHPNPSSLRLVFDLKQAVQLSMTPYQRGLHVELLKAGIASTKSQPAKRHAPAIQSMPRGGMRDVIVVIDAGHGGKDPGASGPRHSLEKHVVLAMALKLKQLIDRQPGMRAVLTRQGDYYVGLRERLNIARRYNADVFVSIHADAFINQHSNGASVFALSQRGATSEAARWLAEKENYSELGGVNLSDLNDRNGVVRSVLLDLSQTATITSSLHMGGRVLHSMDRITNLHNQKVEQARFMVLKSPDIPSILIETGFISNPREERNLNSSAYQTQLARAIFEGLKGYFWEYPPHGTRLEVMSGVNSRLAKQGRVSSFWG